MGSHSEHQRTEGCNCVPLLDYQKAKGMYFEVSGNIDKRSISSENYYEAKFDYDSTRTSISLKIPNIFSDEKEYREFQYYGHNTKFKESLFLTKWCDLWRSYSNKETCHLKIDSLDIYYVKIEKLIKEFGFLNTQISDTLTLPRPLPTEEKLALSKENVCIDTVLRPKYYGWESFLNAKLNEKDLIIKSDDLVFCFKRGDVLYILGEKNQEKYIIL